MTTNTSTQNDVITLSFINPITLQQSIQVAVNGSNINDATTINIEKDYFIPSNGLIFTIEDDRINQLTQFLQRGWKVQVAINGNVNFIGYIFDYHLTYNRTGGTKLIVKCKDLLEYMAQGTVYPNMGTNNVVNFHFQPTDTLDTALTTIAQAFVNVTGQAIDIQVDDSSGLTAATGFNVGLRSTGKTPASRQTSLQKAFGHLTTPNKGESYLAYMLRLAKLNGCNIKMDNVNPALIIVKPPTYNRTNTSPFALNHYLTAPNNANNNVLEAGYFFNFDKQPSVVVVEASTTGNGAFYQSTLKGVAVNEMTGYPYTADSAGNVSPIASVEQAVTYLTNGQLGAGYSQAPFNDQLYATRGTIPIDIATQVSLPYYTVSNNAHTSDEASFAASKILAEAQDHYIEFTYRVQGWTMIGTSAVWQPDMLVAVTEEAFSPGNPKTIIMWIRRVNFTLKRGDGAMTELVCTLPYTHNFEITQE